MATGPIVLNIPQPLTFDGNRKQKWRTFLKDYKICINAAYSENSKKSQASYLLNWAGEDAKRYAESFTYKDEKKDNGTVIQKQESPDDPEDLITKFTELCNPFLNNTIERHNFNTRVQLRKGERDPNSGILLKEDEDIAHFIGRLRVLAGTCEYGDKEEEFIRDRVVSGVLSDKLREQFLRHEKLTLEKVLKTVAIFEQTKLNSRQLKPSSESADVDMLQPRRYKKPQKQMSQKQMSRSHQGNEKNRCESCGYLHRRDYCPATGQQCKKCNGWNHFQECCKKSAPPRRHDQTRSRQRVHELDEYSEGSDDEYYEEEGYTVDDIEVDTVNSEIFTTLHINGKTTEAKIDTGAKCNVMSIETLATVKKK